MHVEVCVEMDEQVEELVRCTGVMREAGDRRQFGREVIRGTRHGWSKLVRLVPVMCNKKRVPDQKLVRARWREARRKGRDIGW